MPSEEDFEKLDKMVGRSSKNSGEEIYCPECGSHRLHYFVGLRAGWIYVCKDCGYQGAVVIEDGDLAKEIRKNWIEEKTDGK